MRQFDTAVNELSLRAEAAPQDWYIQFLLSDAYWFKEMGKESAHATEQGYVLQGDKESADAVHAAFESGGERAITQWMQSYEGQSPQGIHRRWRWRIKLLVSRRKRDAGCWKILIVSDHLTSCCRTNGL
jgi:hypothetical protein